MKFHIRIGLGSRTNGFDFVGDPDENTSYPHYGCSALVGNLFVVETSGYNHNVPRRSYVNGRGLISYLGLLLSK